MTDVVWLSLKPGTPARGYWDQALLELLLKNCRHDPSRLRGDGAVVIIPGAYQGELVEQINELLAKLKWCLVIVTSDEENNFPIDSLSHPNMLIYANYPSDEYEKVHRWLPIGPARFVKQDLPEKDLDWFFAGQVNHESRKACVETLGPLEGGELVETDGFAQGLAPERYHDLLARAKAIPAPRGNVSPDSFRLYEALEAGAVPIPEDREFWTNLFGEAPPFPVIESWDELPAQITLVAQQYPALHNRLVCVAALPSRHRT